MYKVIMAPTDGTGFDREAIRVATQLSARTGAELKLVRVEAEPPVFSGPDTNMYMGEALEEEREWELSQLSELAVECRQETKSSVTTNLEKGPVADALARFAVQHDADLIVISSHGRGGFARVALGSVTDSLLRNTNVPLLVVKPPASYLNPRVQRSFKQILIPLDGSRLAEEILPHVIELESCVVLLNVLMPRTYSQMEIEDPQFPWWEDDVETARTYLSEKADELRKAGVPTTIDLVIADDVADAILLAAARLRVDLIAIATHGRGGLSRLLHGSVTDKVLRTARTSMLVLHPESVGAPEVTVRRKVEFAT